MTLFRARFCRSFWGPLQSLSTRVKRNDPIVFFFSGYSAKSDHGGGPPVGVICPFDITTNGGISDKVLLQAFDLLSQSCGNNITVFLDCVGDCFNWDTPVSCAVIFPNKAAENEEGGVFTSAIIKVVNTQVGQLQSITMTAEEFSERVQSTIARDDVVVHCIGMNVDRPLFNSEAPQGH
ncbi:hypothetical protein BT96DRAFT_91435 [Gymnopus androsaceus JB14]|uniref:Uncharacterized protein n=1 Tax=Gymnopus androsaceus JB14 TaxID=1447944 RepID=A0A6A4HH96_9AGAR|nr:hypothetical protein BT96DRAFT_91435 [Gymnopus androsaceus JB14]